MIQSSVPSGKGFLETKKILSHRKAIEVYENRDASKDQEVSNSLMNEGEIALDDGSAAAFSYVAANRPPIIKKPKTLVCRRCHDLMTSGRVAPLHVPEDDYKTHIKHLKRVSAVIVCVVDVFDLFGSIHSELRELLANSNVVLAVNKVDILPLDVKKNEAELVGWVGRMAKDIGVTCHSIHLISAATSFGVNKLFKTIHELCVEKACEAYVVGCTNVGKSSLVNSILTGSQVTASALPGTTLGRIPLALDGTGARPALRHVPVSSTLRPSEIRIYDTPGIINKEQALFHLTPEEHKAVLPTKTITPLTFILPPGKSLLLGGLARLDYINGPDTAYFTVFASSYLQRHIHCTSTSHVPDLMASHHGIELLTPPFGGKERMTSFPCLHGPLLQLTGQGYQKHCKDLMLAGIGFVSVAAPIGAQLEIKANVPNGVGVALRASLDPHSSTQHGPLTSYYKLEPRRTRPKRFQSLAHLSSKGSY